MTCHMSPNGFNVPQLRAPNVIKFLVFERTKPEGHGVQHVDIPASGTSRIVWKVQMNV